jgi:hypothetical protein
MSETGHGKLWRWKCEKCGVVTEVPFGKRPPDEHHVKEVDPYGTLRWTECEGGEFYLC